MGSEGIMVASYTANGEMFGAVKPRLWTKVKDLVNYSLAPDGRRFAVVQAGASDRVGGAQVTSC